MSRRVKYFFFISFSAFAIFLAVAFVSSHPSEWPFGRGGKIRDVTNLSGPVGSLLAYVLFGALGRVFAWVVPFALAVVGAGLLVGRSRAALRMILKSGLVVILLGAFFGLIPLTQGSPHATGNLGSMIARLASAVLGSIGGAILIITCLLLIFLTEVRYLGRAATDGLGRVLAYRPPLGAMVSSLRKASRRRVEGIREWAAPTSDEPYFLESDPVTPPTPPAKEAAGGSARVDPDPWPGPQINIPVGSHPEEEAVPVKREAAPTRPRRTTPAKPVEVRSNGIPLEKAVLPQMSMLNSGAPSVTAYSEDKLKSWSRILEDKLGNYGVEGRVTAVNQGPLVTTFEFEPAPGVKIKDIVSRSDDLALAMRARSLRLIAPIPGRAVVGIEIPNPDHDVVYLSKALSEIPERLRYSGIMIALGVDAIGKPFNMNLCSAPHVLLAGTTGSGKSVALNVILASILFQYRPSDVRLLLVDPKMVEMSVYNGIPHLLHPVITDPREAVRLFNFLIGEMERRNDLLRRHAVKNIESFNSKVALGRVDPESEAEKLPYIVLVVDELADLVLTKGVDFESLLSRLSNMARAVGIHMIVATQRPSVDVIDGKTKANFPTRIAFRVATKVDSRTILDTMGAEKLLGKGDMLYVDAKHPEALRLHGAWVSDDEVEQLVAHWKQYEFDELQLELVEPTPDTLANDEKDAYFEDAKGIILRYRQGSTSLLQRKLHVGYARAARLLDQLEQAGIVGPPDGSKPREVLIKEMEQLSPNLDD